MAGSGNKCYLTVLISKVTHGENLSIFWHLKGEFSVVIGHGAIL